MTNFLKPTKLKRFLFFLIADFFISVFSTIWAFYLRFSGDMPEVFQKGLLLSCLFLAIFKIFYLWSFKIYLVPWRFFGLYEAKKIFLAHFLAALSFFILFLLLDDVFNPFPRSVIIIDAAISYILISGFRIIKRMFLDSSKKSHQNEPCVVIGATKKAVHIIKGIKEGYINYYAVGVYDERKELVGTSFESFSVRDKSKLKDDIKKQNIKTAIIALRLEQDELNKLHNELIDFGIRDVKVFSLLEKESIRDISIEDLLARKPKDLNDDIVKDFMFEKVVLVTGAGGTIGSEICKQCLKFGVKRLIMLDHSEFNLYKINEITKSNKKNVLKLLSVINLKDIEDEVFKEFDIDIVIHAAAYKHVPLCEFNIKSAVKNNILGTKNMIDLSNKYNVKRFVLISTDKAVRPTSIMGTTKRICELYALNQNSKTEFVAVRFGNVLGSSGSVIPKFKEQIKNGENLTVTHPDIVRYFMLVSEACQLVLQAASIAKGGELFVLDMGKQVKIADLAKKMLELANRTDLKVVFTGLRPGEKLYEELLIDENDKQTKFESIFVTNSQKYDLNLLNLQINELLNLDEKDIESKLCEIVPEFSHALNKKD